MPHDRNGNLLHVGDSVAIPGKITSLTTGEDYCNITVVTDVPMLPGTSPTYITLNGGQVDQTAIAGPTIEPMDGPAITQA